MPAAEVIEIGQNVETYREAAAKRIKQLMHNWTANTLALAAELAKAAETFPTNPKKPNERMGFRTWATKTTGLSANYVYNLVQVHKTFAQRRGAHQLSGKVMVLLSRPTVPETARQEVLKRSEAGDTIGRGEVAKLIKKHALPTPKAANQQAKEEGQPVLASDGYIYFGTDPGRAKEGEDRRTMVYGVRKALDTLGKIHLTGRQFLAYAMPHQLWTAEEQHIIKDALRWLQDLDEAWEARE